MSVLTGEDTHCDREISHLQKNELFCESTFVKNERVSVHPTF